MRKLPRTTAAKRPIPYGFAPWRRWKRTRAVNSLFAGNSAGRLGAALALASPGRTTILFSTFASPTLDSGAAIVATTGTVGITDTIFTNYSIGISLTGGSAFENYNLFFGVPVTTAGGVAHGSQSLGGDPAFSEIGHDDYHLTAASAARNAGVDAGVGTDFEGDPRPFGGGFDIGFDQYGLRLFLPLARR